MGRRQREGQGARPGTAAPNAGDLPPHAGVRHLLAAYALHEDKLFGHVKPRRTRTRFLEFCRYLRSLYPLSTRIAIICDNFSPHLTTDKDGRAGARAAASPRAAWPTGFRSPPSTPRTSPTSRSTTALYS